MRTETFRATGAALTAFAAFSCASPPTAVAPVEQTPRRELAPPVALSPQTISIPDVSPRPAALRLLEQTRFSLNVQDADLASLILSRLRHMRGRMLGLFCS